MREGVERGWGGDGGMGGDERIQGRRGRGEVLRRMGLEKRGEREGGGRSEFGGR